MANAKLWRVTVRNKEGEFSGQQFLARETAIVDLKERLQIALPGRDVKSLLDQVLSTGEDGIFVAHGGGKYTFASMYLTDNS